MHVTFMIINRVKVTETDDKSNDIEGAFCFLVSISALAQIIIKFVGKSKVLFAQISLKIKK